MNPGEVNDIGKCVEADSAQGGGGLQIDQSDWNQLFSSKL